MLNAVNSNGRISYFYLNERHKYLASFLKTTSQAEPHRNSTEAYAGFMLLDLYVILNEIPCLINRAGKIFYSFVLIST